MNVDTDRVQHSCDVQYIAVGWLGMWSLCGCFAFEIKMFKYEKYFKTLPLPASLNCHASMGQLRFVSSGANTLISVETYFKFCISEA